MRRSGGPGRREELGLEQPMEVNDVVARLRAVDRLLGLGAPGSLGAGVIGEKADDVELVGVTEFVAFERFQFAAKHQVQPLRLCLVWSLRIGGTHDRISLRSARSCAGGRAALCPRRGKNASVRSPPPVSAATSRWRRGSP